MELLSVQALRNEIRAEGPRALAPEVYAELAAEEAEAVDRSPFPVALGIVGRPGGDCRLAVRAMRWNEEVAAVIEKIRQRAADEIEVQIVGRIEAQQVDLRAENRPLCLGCSCAHRLEPRGSLGCFVRKAQAQELFILSNNHVLARENRPIPFDDVTQPALVDNGTLAHVVADSIEFVQLIPQHNLVDAGIARITNGVGSDRRTLFDLGALAGVRDTVLATADRVFKVGRTTFRTEGVVNAWDLSDVEVEYASGTTRFFDHQIEIEPLPAGPRFSDRGDSGALVVDSELRAAGLLFGGLHDGTKSYANQIGRVFDLLGVELAL